MGTIFSAVADGQRALFAVLQSSPENVPDAAVPAGIFSSAPIIAVGVLLIYARTAMIDAGADIIGAHRYLAEFGACAHGTG